MRTLTIVVAALVTCGAASPSDEVADLKRICAGLVGHQALSSPWHELRPFLSDPYALDASKEMLCGASCTDSLPLRHGFRLDYVYVNPAHIGRWRPDDAIVYSVTLYRGKKALFHSDLKPKKA
jgi:hypothetical protein